MGLLKPLARMDVPDSAGAGQRLAQGQSMGLPNLKAKLTGGAVPAKMLAIATIITSSISSSSSTTTTTTNTTTTTITAITTRGCRAQQSGLDMALVAVRGEFSKLESDFGTLESWVPHYNLEPKGAHDFENITVDPK